MKQVARAAKGYPERAYAKWLVVHYLWSYLSPTVRAASGASAFRKLCEGNRDSLKQLQRSANSAFNAALAFYRKKRGKGATAIDVSSFFRKRGLNSEFTKFWSSPANRFRGSFRKAWNRFEKDLEEAKS